MRLKELLETKGMTVYALAKAVEQRGVSEQAVYRLARLDGAAQRFDARLLVALYDVLGCHDFNELFTRNAVNEYAPYTPPRKRKVA